MDRDYMFYESETMKYLKVYADDKAIDKDCDLHKINQMRWNAVLLFVYKHVYAITDSDVKYNNRKSNIDYDNGDLLNSICDLYINVCYEYGKEVSIAGFSKLTGIDYSTIISWGSKEYRHTIYKDSKGNKIYNLDQWLINHKGEEYSEELSLTHSNIYKKLSSEREACLTSMTLQGNIGALAMGKIEKGWVEGQQVVHVHAVDTKRTPDQIAQDYGIGLPDRDTT